MQVKCNEAVNCACVAALRGSMMRAGGFASLCFVVPFGLCETRSRAFGHMLRFLSCERLKRVLRRRLLVTSSEFLCDEFGAVAALCFSDEH